MFTRRRQLAGGLFVAFGATFADVSSARAATPEPAASPAPASATPEALAEGRLRFNRGVELFREGNYGGALAEFEAGYHIAPSFRILYNLGQARYELQDYVGAIRDFHAYLDQGGDKLPAARRAEVEKELDKLTLRIATLVIHTTAKEAQVLVDGVVTAKLTAGSTRVRVSSGRRRIEVIFPGRPTEVRVLDLAGATESALEVNPQTMVAVAPLPPSLAAPPKLWPYYIGIGVGVAGTMASIALAANARGLYNESIAAVNPNRDRSERLRDLTRGYAFAADAFAVGAGAVVALLIYKVVSRPKREPNLVPAVSVTPQNAGVLTLAAGVSGRF